MTGTTTGDVPVRSDVMRRLRTATAAEHQRPEDTLDLLVAAAARTFVWMADWCNHLAQTGSGRPADPARGGVPA